jgi:WD repeat-containing protein 68
VHPPLRGASIAEVYPAACIPNLNAQSATTSRSNLTSTFLADSRSLLPTRRDAMPFGHHSQNAQNNTPASGLYQAAAALGSIGAPMGNLRVATGQTTSAGTDAFVHSPVENPAYAGGGHTAPPAAQSSYEAPRRQPTMSRAGDSELHISTTNPTAASQQHQQSMYNAQESYSAPNIQLQQATPGHIPNALQAGQQRPGPPSTAYTAPAVPTQNQNQSQIATNAQQYTLPTRSNTIHQSPHSSHSYSRSSPAGLGPEQKYIPFSNTPEQSSKYAANTPAQKHYPTTPSGAASHSPLGLADIRPRANSTMDQDGGLGYHGNAMITEQSKVASNSNYLAPWSIYAYDWCKWAVPGGNSAGKMAVGSYLEDNHNFIRILDTQIVPQEAAAPGASPYGLEYTAVAEATCSFPVTRILWEPPSSQKQSTDLLATSGDHLRLWSLPQNSGNTMSNTITRSSSVNTREPQLPKLTPLALLSNSKTPEHTAPLTSLDWNTLSPKLIITSSIDTTCTIWDIPSLTAKTQLIAHDKEVFDVRFCAGSVDVFVSCGADGSVRMFDLRSLEHSTIIYEPSDKNGDRDKGQYPYDLALASS